jgi:probable F420-dependent oxidoreductase
VNLTGTGVWAAQLRYGDPGEIAERAAELEGLGYTGLWIPDVGGDVFSPLALLLESTTTAVVAPGILNVWMHTAEETAAWRAGLPAERQDRLLLGLGISHAPIIDGDTPGRWTRPLAVMGEYLDALDAAPEPVPAGARVLAALGPRMLELARDRARGAHPYLVTPEHTAQARETLGPDALLCPEQHVVLETDPDEGRALARAGLSHYLALPNYVNNLRLLGFGEDDVADGGSDRLADEVVVWGDEDAIAARVQEHRDAGADHVCVQVITAGDAPWPALRRLAPALTGSR